MHASNLLMCKAGGLIVTDALTDSLPMIIIDAIACQETGNAELVIQGGAGELALQPLKALQAVAHLLMNDSALLKEKRGKSHQLGQPQAALWVSQRVMEMAESGPKILPASSGLERLIDLLFRNHVRWQKQLSLSDRKPSEDKKETPPQSE